MKKMLLVPVMCLLCIGCSTDEQYCKNGSTQNDQDQLDTEITTMVKANILSDTTISASARFVHVTTTNRVVTLVGEVPTKEDRERIYKIAMKTRCVQRVENNITIQAQ